MILYYLYPSPWQSNSCLPYNQLRALIVHTQLKRASWNERDRAILAQDQIPEQDGESLILELQQLEDAYQRGRPTII